ncbi:MAG: penicillin-binding protein 2 [Candidatus Doudnabacteria bacterium]|nr:penicillin-binding protein 2 [Candidatus Doudnabacteria bacterium]
MIKQRIKPDQFGKRTALVTVFLFFMFLAVGARLFFLQVINGKAARALAEDQHSIFTKLLAQRGEIKISDKFSKEPITVAGNIKKPLVYAVPKDVLDPGQTAIQLAAILKIDEQEILKRFEDKSRKYVPIKRQITEKQQEDIKALKLPGIFFDYEEIRVYPENNLLSHVLGYVGYKDQRKEGLYGLERYFEKELAGKNGSLLEEAGAKGNWVFGATRDRQPAEDGVNLILTIDKSIQFKAESVVKEAVKKHGADSGSVIVSDPKTGAVLAMAGYPDFSPNEYNKVDDPQIFLNQASVGAYESGSVFKPLTMAMAINEGKVGPDTIYTDAGFVEIDGHTIKNSDLKAHGKQTMTQVLEQSLNTGAIFAKEQIGNDKFFDYVKAFGFGKSTGLELLEHKGNLDNLKADIKVNYHTASFGQGISVTPIQLIQAFSAIANGGKMMKPHLVKAKIDSDGRYEETPNIVVKEVIADKTANTVAAMMVSVVENGHGKRAGVKGYYIAGKTGTAQVPRKDGKGYEEGNNIGSFIGFGPAEDPKFLMLVRINHPRDVTFAESTAAPAFGEIAQFILNYYNIPPTRLDQQQ